MININKFITGSVVGLVAVFFAASGAMAANTIDGNGAFSFNKVYSKNTTYMSKNQTNVTTFSNGVSTKTNTGWNKSNFNVGGTSSATGGSADTTVGVTNVAGANVSEGSGEVCCCGLTDGTNTITDNGAFSYNKIVDSQKCVVKSNQTNVTTVVNSVNTVTNTGGNSSSFNVGSGSSATGGDATTTVTVSNTAGLNVSM